jgi:3-hydroxyacyl-CoA dehydrogenase
MGQCLAFCVWLNSVYCFSGKAGRGWAMLFAASGFKVCIYDNISKQLEDGLADIHSQMDKLKSTGQQPFH